MHMWRSTAGKDISLAASLSLLRIKDLWQDLTTTATFWLMEKPCRFPEGVAVGVHAFALRKLS